jgi:pyruvate dehydrogenase E2 component (dihydrolipoamide acetyltransferase)
MAEAVLMIALSPTMEKGTIASWQKSVGDAVATGDVLCEVETDKATMDYESTQEGTLLSILTEEGGSAAMGDPIAIIGDEGEDPSELEKKLKSKQKSKDSGSGDSEESGKAEEKHDSRESSESPEGGGADSKPDKPDKEKDPGGRIKASPLARRLAKDAGIALKALDGSGPGRRIVKKDIEAAPEGAVAGAAAGAGASRSAQSARSARTAPAKALSDRSEGVSGKRAIIARRLTESMQEAPHYFLDIEVDAGRLLGLRSEVNGRRSKRGEEKLSLNSFLIKLVAETIGHHPQINASWEGEQIRYFGSVDIGLAVAQKDGLITPIVRNSRNKGIEEIDLELGDLIPRAQSGKLSPEEYEGASFSITNLGAWGISRFTAVINPPSSAILAVGALQKKAVPDDEKGFRFADIFTLTLGCDHRVIDGAVGAAFLADLRAILEEPGMALM